MPWTKIEANTKTGHGSSWKKTPAPGLVWKRLPLDENQRQHRTINVERHVVADRLPSLIPQCRPDATGLTSAIEDVLNRRIGTRLRQRIRRQTPTEHRELHRVSLLSKLTHRVRALREYGRSTRKDGA